MTATLDAVPLVSGQAASPQTTAAQAVVPARAAHPLRLTTTAAAAAKRVGPWVAKGLAVRKRRVRDRAALDAARTDKAAWVRGYGDQLRELFNGPAVADACTDWPGRILPDYAPVGLFVEQFYEEMDHRLRRLQAVVDHLDDMAAEEAASNGGGGASGGPGGTSPASLASAGPAAKDEPKGRSLNWARLFPTVDELTHCEAGTATEVPRPKTTAAAPAASAAAAVPTAGQPPAGSFASLVKPTGLLLVRTADDAAAVSAFLTDLAVAPRVVAAADADNVDPEALMASGTPPAFALVWPPAGGADPAAAPRFQFRLGFLVGRLGAARVCLVTDAGAAAAGGAVGSAPHMPPAVPTVALDAHGGWQLPLARALKRAGVQVDLNRLC